MSAWYWRVIALKSAFILSCLLASIKAEDTVQKLPFCNPHNVDKTSITNDLVLVSTLDGKLTAFSTQNGVKAWDLETRPLLTSNLHHVELTSSGKWVRLVPSLRGSLYSLSGDTIEPLPFDADQLLSSSFKYSDDLVIAGARETQWLGLDVQTGGVIYECGTSGCNGEQTAGTGKEVLVLRRHSSTVRALDPRSGSEKWNFSVAEHNLALNRRECLNTAVPTPPSNVAIAVALPDGEIGVKTGDGPPLWSQKLEAPVAGVWRLQGGKLQNMDLLYQATKELAHKAAPTLYVGVHCNQLYIQESQLYAQKLQAIATTKFKPTPWKVVNARPLIGDNSDTALSVLEDTSLTFIGSPDSDKSESHGFFLYLQETCDQSVQVTDETFEDTILPNISDDRSNHIHIHVYSLWFWWKEVLLIAVSSALLMNLMIWPRFFAPKIRPSTPLPLNQEVIVVETHHDRSVPNTPEYSGRYENDFTPLRCLGKGGFGVVFEARNNIDHCSYAVKRITLPRRESKRERVLREVRALAKLEHENIVRYFNSWVETPPPLWQETRDLALMKDLEGVSLLSEEYTSPTPLKARKDGSVTLNLQKGIDDCVDALEFDKKLSEPKRLRSRSCNDSFSIVFDEDASKNAHLTSEHSKNTNSQINPNSLQINSNSLKITPNSMTKVVGASGDDSFIVFANTNDDSGLSEARHNSSINKHLEKVKECEFTKEVTSGTQKSSRKKKGHTRHWSLDLCVRPDNAHIDTKMYLYIQMQLCQRDNLHDWIRQNRNTKCRYEKVKDLFSQIVAAVEYIHSAGLIHRDLKPSNIFFAPDGRVRVGDFGLVTAMSDNSRDGEVTGEVNVYARHTYKVGTHLYMSPEQILGRPYNYKVDIFSLGIILFELLQPFFTESERVACLMKVRNGHYPRQFEQDYPIETSVLQEMLSEDPLSRPNAHGVRMRAPLFGKYMDGYTVLRNPLDPSYLIDKPDMHIPNTPKY